MRGPFQDLRLSGADLEEAGPQRRLEVRSFLRWNRTGLPDQLSIRRERRQGLVRLEVLREMRGLFLLHVNEKAREQEHKRRQTIGVRGFEIEVEREARRASMVFKEDERLICLPQQRQVGWLPFQGGGPRC